MKNNDQKCELSQQTTSLLAPTSKITEAIANAPSDEHAAEFRKLSCEVTGMRCERAAERILSQGLAMQWMGSEVEHEGRMADLEMLIELAVKFLLNATAKGQTKVVPIVKTIFGPQ